MITADRLFVPAVFAGLLAEMPAATATPWDRWEWLDTTFGTLRAAVRGSHGLEAIRLAQVIDRYRHAARDEIENSATASAA